MEAAPGMFADGSAISVAGALVSAFPGPHVVPLLMTSGLIAGALVTGMN